MAFWRKVSQCILSIVITRLALIRCHIPNCLLITSTFRLLVSLSRSPSADNPTKMSKEGGFGFTHLVEEDDDDQEAPIGSGNLEVNLQPHLSGSPSLDSRGRETQHAAGGFDNPALQVDDDHEDGKQSNTNGPSHSSGKFTAQQTNGATSADLTSASSASNTNNNEGTVSPTNIQVQYDNSQGKVNVMQGQVVTHADGTRHIDTRGIPQRWSELERPLRQSRMRYLKIFSIIACIFFFPSGIPAVYFAFRTQKEFDEGIMRGNIDRAQKFAKRSEQFIILSFIMSIVMAALIVAIVERPYYYNGGVHMHRGTVVG